MKSSLTPKVEPTPKIKSTLVELSSKEIDHICNILTLDADTIEQMMEDNKANKTDEGLVRDLKANLSLIVKLADLKG